MQNGGEESEQTQKRDQKNLFRQASQNTRVLWMRLGASSRTARAVRENALCQEEAGEIAAPVEQGTTGE
ncbi:hypothetical protein ACQKK5_00740 [Brevibacillus panacihumi]|uniref:hypothetical protein n=1 Tax=Brevibacillus panacihumi TaxID=497735 RepID=UPI003D076E1B